MPEDQAPAMPAFPDLPRLVFEAVGQASMCWDPRPMTAVFDSTAASAVAEKLIADIGAQLPKPGAPDLHAGNVVPFICKRLAVHGAIVLLSNDDGTIGVLAHGVNHGRANEMLSRGVQINLNQHDDSVRRGDAGDDAAALQDKVDTLAPEGAL